jgi:pimeloyl-ACP methyl ester carboxylesterase
MARRKPDLELLRVANRGHAPTLDEPECVTAIESFLLRISAS